MNHPNYQAVHSIYRPVSVACRAIACGSMLKVIATGLLATILPAILAPQDARAAITGWNQTAAGTYDYNNSLNWADSDGTPGPTLGDINGIWGSDLTVAGTQTVTFLPLTQTLAAGLDIRYTGNFSLTLRGDATDANAKSITLGGNITYIPSDNTTLTIGSTTSTGQNLNIDLDGATRTFTTASNRTLTFTNVISNGGLITSGGTVNLNGINTYAGSTTVISGNLQFNSSLGGAANSDITVKAGGASTSQLILNGTASGNVGATRAKSVTLNGAGSSAGAQLTSAGNSGNNNLETITNALTITGGHAQVGLSANASRNIQLTAGTYARNTGSTVLFRGTNLGVNSIASLTTGSANIWFGSAPALVGSGSVGTSTVGILKGAFGDITSTGTGANGGLVTYDTTNGIRLLNTATEYTTGIANGQTQADNVLYTRVSGGASQDINLTSSLTTIGSLSFKITGVGTDSGVTIGGDVGTTLKINSGSIFASQTVTTPVATDAMTISVPTLDLNGREGTIITFTSGISNSNSAAPLYISSVITNDGGNGVTIGGTGQVRFTGSQANTYTGATTINSGILRLEKSALNIGLTTDLIMNGGTLIKNSNAIADAANVTINGGGFVMDSTTSSGNNGHQETINNFTMNGGSVGNSSGSGAALTINGNATLNASQLGMNQGGDIVVLGTTTLNGGLLRARESSSTSTANGLTSLNTVNITNQASGTYTAITLLGHATNLGARLTLNGNVTFIGNATNTNTVLIASSDLALANQGLIALNGNRTFNIGDGAAAHDLTIVPAMTDGTSAGALTKTGAGTLLLNGANAYSGTTVVSAGTLALGANGSIAGSQMVELNAGGTLDTTAQNFSMLLTQPIRFNLNGAGAGSAGLLNAGNLNIGNGIVDFSTTGMLDDYAYVIANYTSLSGGVFASVNNLPTGYTINYAYSGGTQIALVAVPEPGTWLLMLGGIGLLLGGRALRGNRKPARA